MSRGRETRRGRNVSAKMKEQSAPKRNTFSGLVIVKMAIDLQQFVLRFLADEHAEIFRDGSARFILQNEKLSKNGKTISDSFILIDYIFITPPVLALVTSFE